CLTLSQHTTQQLRALAKKEQASLFMLLLAAFKVLLYGYTNQHDILVGTDESGRNHQAVEGLIGFFINHLVLRTDLSGNPSFRELLGRVRAVCLGAYSHQDLPFDRLVEVLRPDRVSSHTPVFQVLFVMNNTAQSVSVEGSVGGLEEAGLRMSG